MSAALALDFEPETQLIYPCAGGPAVTHDWHDLGGGVYVCTAGGEILTGVTLS